MYSKEERMEVGKNIYENTYSYQHYLDTLNVSRSTLVTWINLYKESIGAPKGKRPNPSLTPNQYKDMTSEEKDELLMAKDIEIERLKKGYVVKGVGASKEFVTTFDANMK